MARRRKDPEEYAARRALARALPIMGDGEIPAERDLRVEDDRDSLVSIVKLFLRSWPFIRPQFFGRWLSTGAGRDDEAGYSHTYLPYLVTALALLGPTWFGVLPAHSERHVLYVLAVYACIAGLTAWSWVIAFSRDARLRVIATAVALLLAAYGNVVAAPAAIPEFAASQWIAWVSATCAFGWLVQLRLRDGRIEARLRVATHLVYFFSMVYLQRLVGLATGLVLADLLFQSILQADPVIPALVDAIGRPELARGVLERTLTVEERYHLQWVYIGISVGLLVAMTPLRILCGGGEYSWVMYGTGSGWYRIWILQRINQDLRTALVARWHSLSLSYHSDHRTGDSIFRIYQDSAQVTAVIDRLMSVAMTVFGYLVGVFLVSLLSPWLGLIMAAVAVPTLFWARWAMPRMRTRALVARSATSDVTSRLQESFSALRLIKAYGAEERVRRKVAADSAIVFNAAYRVRVLIALVGIVTFTIVAVALLGSEYLIARWAYRGESTFSVELIAFIGLSFVTWNLAAHQWTRDQFLGAADGVRWLISQWMSAQDMAMGLKRVFDILDLEPDVVDADDAVPLTAIRREIRFDDVGFSYQPDRPVLESVSFGARPGDITAIVGPTGSGKSTLMALLLRLYDPDGGAITVDGVDLRGYTVSSLRANMAIALQENVLFALSVRDNIRYVAPDADDDAVMAAIRIACMEDYVDGLPDGLDTVLGDRGGRISTGQRQRLSIARAVVRDTPVLILDEPTAALDADTENRVMTNLSRWASGVVSGDGAGDGERRAVFLVTHRISTIRRAHNILYLDDGRIVESGDHDALMAIPRGRYRAFVEVESHLARAGG